MAVKGMAFIVDITGDSSTTFDAYVRVVSIDVTVGSYSSNFHVPHIDPQGLTSAAFESAIKQAAKNELINNAGVTFGLFDVVKLVGASLL